MNARMWNRECWVWLGLALFVPQVAIVWGCVTTKVSVPNEARLRERFNASLNAYNSGDFDTQYELLPPRQRTHLTREEFKKGRPETRPSGTLRGEFVEFCWCKKGVMAADPSTVRCTAIVSLTREEPGGHRETTRLWEAWDYEDGEWYHFHTEDFDKCPQR